MSWPEQKTENRCKVRKRGCLSSPSSSTLVHKNRFKKAPTWKMSTKSHSSKLSTGEVPSLDGGVGKGKEGSVSVSVSVSARKSNSQKLKNNSDVVEEKKELIKTRELVSQISHSCLSDPDPSLKNNNNNANSEKVEGGRVHRRRRSASSMRIGIGEVVGGSNFHGNANHCLMEIENGSMVKTRRSGKTKLMVKTGLKEVRNCLTTSKELLRVLKHVWGHDDQERPSSTLSLIAALKSEIDRAKRRVDELMKDERLDGDELIEVVMKRFAEEKAAWKYRERARVGSALASMADEVEVEKKLRRQAERLNKRIAKELADAKVRVSKAMKDVEREKRGKEILEQICEELAKGIGEDRAEFEELRKESKKVREEVEKEREMLQLADVLREERVQMKLSEAKFQFEEKNAAVERLKHQLQAYFITQLNNHENEHENENENGQQSAHVNDTKFDKIKELEAYLKRINFGSCQDHPQSLEQKEEDDDDDCSEEEESDLHSIELNMDNNNKSYRWSFVNGSQQDQIQWETICLNNINNSKSSSGDHHQLPPKTHDLNSDALQLFPPKQDQYFHNQLAADHIQIHHSNNNNSIKSVKCLRDILFPEAAAAETDHQNQVPITKTENHNNPIIAMNLQQLDEACSVAMRKG